MQRESKSNVVSSTVTRRSVLFIAPQPFFVNRGTPLNVRAFVCRMAELGFDVHLLTFPYGEDVPMPGVTTHRCPRLPWVKRIAIGFSWNKLCYDLLLLVHGLVLALRCRIDIVHGVEEGGVLAGCLGLLLRRPYVVDMDSCIPEQLAESSLARFPFLLRCCESIENFFLRRAAAIVTVCESLTVRARKVAGSVPIFQIEDFPIDSSTEVNPAHAARITSELSITDRSVVLYTGNLEPYQGIDLLLEAFCHVQRAAEDLSPLLLIVGGDGDRLQWYRAQVERLGLSSSVRCLGARPIEEMGTYMSIAHVLASPRTVGENTPLKLYTYMISGKPVVATNIRSHTQALDDDCAFLSDPDPVSFAEALHAALRRDEQSAAVRSLRAARALEIVESRFSRRAFDRRVAELYGFLTPSRSTSRTSDPSYSAVVSGQPPVGVPLQSPSTKSLGE